MRTILPVLFLTISFSGISNAGLSKCADFVIGMQSSDVSSLKSVFHLGKKVGMNFEEYTECKQAIMSQDRNLLHAVVKARSVIKKQ